MKQERITACKKEKPKHVVLTSLADILATSVQALDNRAHKLIVMAVYTTVRIGSTKTCDASVNGTR